MERIANAQYYHAKQSCYLCHNPNDVIDTSIPIEGEGVLAICRSCIADMARTVGFDLTDRRDEIDLLEQELVVEREARQSAERMLVQIGDYEKKLRNMAVARAAKEAKKVDA